MCISAKGHSTLPPVLQRNTVFQRTPIYIWVRKTKDSSNTDGSVSFALILRITMTVIKKEVEIKSLLPRNLEKKIPNVQGKEDKKGL